MPNANMVDEGNPQMDFMFPWYGLTNSQCEASLIFIDFLVVDITQVCPKMPSRHHCSHEHGLSFGGEPPIFGQRLSGYK